MQANDIKSVVAEVLAEQTRLHNNDVDRVALETIAKILTSFGIDEDDRAELRADFQHLRRWRKSTEQITRAGWRAMVTVAVTGFCGIVWLGIKAMLAK